MSRKKPSSERERRSHILSVEDWKAIDNAAASVGALYSGRPSWRRLLLLIARGEVVVRPACKRGSDRTTKQLTTMDTTTEHQASREGDSSSSALLASLPPHDRWMIEAINKPEFDKATRVHDWRNYVPKTIEKVWSHLSEEARLVAIIMAEEEASNENWE